MAEDDCRARALALLARREHSRFELAGKLSRRGYPAEAVAACLDALEESGLLSDARYAESYVRSRVEKGYGPLRIRQELRERGVAASLAEAALADYKHRWPALAQRQYRRKFGATRPADYRDWARRARYLGGRGFSAEHMRALFDDEPNHETE